MSLPVAILAGGLATRLKPLTDALPKSLVDVAGRPFAAWQIDRLRECGFTDLVFLVGHLGDRICEALGDGRSLGVRLRYASDGPSAAGTGGAIRRALPLLGPEFLVLYGDSYLECDYGAVADAFRRAGTLGLMTICRNDGRWDASNVLLEDGCIRRYDKRSPEPAMRHIDYGLGAFRASAFESRPFDEPFDLAMVYRELVERGELAAFEVRERFYEIGSPAGLAETRAHLAAKGMVCS